CCGRRPSGRWTGCGPPSASCWTASPRLSAATTSGIADMTLHPPEECARPSWRQSSRKGWAARRAAAPVKLPRPPGRRERVSARAEVLRAALDSYGASAEVLTDNGSQYVTWSGKSAFTRELEKRGVRQVVTAPRHPQTHGKIERF